MPNIGPVELLIIALIAAVPLAILWLLIRVIRARPEVPNVPPSWEPRPDPALVVLRERFARGEIDATEFEERKRTLGG